MKQGWEVRKLGEVCKICLGLTHTPKYVEDGVPFVSVKDISQGCLSLKDTKRISPEEFESMPDGAKPKKGDVLFCRVGTIGKPQILALDEPFGIFVSVGFLRMNPNCLNTYAKYWMDSTLFISQVEKNVQGSTLKNLNTGWLKEFKIPVPPLPEQQRIVEFLDTEFAKIDALKANTEKNLQHAKDLFQAALKEELQPKEGWVTKTLGEVCNFQNGFAFKSNTFTQEGERILRISDIQNEEIVESGMVSFKPESYREDLSRFLVYPNDIVIAMSGGTTGKLGVNKTNKTFYLNQRVGVFRENTRLLDHQYLYYFLKTKSEESLRIAAGAAQPNLSTAQINSFEIPVPPLPEQSDIVSRLDAISERCNTLQANYSKTIALCDDMKQALLRKAFSGEL